MEDFNHGKLNLKPRFSRSSGKNNKILDSKQRKRLLHCIDSRLWWLDRIPISRWNHAILTRTSLKIKSFPLMAAQESLFTLSVALHHKRGRARIQVRFLMRS
jgi:hypothetical protein